MDEASNPATTGKAAFRASRALSGLVIFFFLMDGAMKRALPPLGSTALHAFPRTAVPDAILLTGYLGGAVATHVRVGSPLFTHVLFGVYMEIIVWGGLWLRDPRLRALIPLRG